MAVARAPLKLLLVGPSKARKSGLASFVAGVTDGVHANTGPTVGVRILEVERGGVVCEVWDVAGDQQFEATWPAVQKGADGVLLVYNPELAGHAKEIELWHEWFVAKLGIPPECVAAWALSGAPTTAPLASLPDVAVEPFTLDSTDALRRAFDRFVQRLANAKSASFRR